MVEKTHEKTVALNRRASHDYFLEEKFECGIVLTGTEIKSVRQGKIQFQDCENSQCETISTLENALPQ